MDLITLKNGPTIPADAILLYLDLERRGYQFAAEGDTLKLIAERDSSGTARDTLSENDRSAIKKWKHHLLAVVSYDAPPIS